MKKFFINLILFMFTGFCFLGYIDKVYANSGVVSVDSGVQNLKQFNLKSRFSNFDEFISKFDVVLFNEKLEVLPDECSFCFTTTDDGDEYGSLSISFWIDQNSAKSVFSGVDDVKFEFYKLNRADLSIGDLVYVACAACCDKEGANSFGRCSCTISKYWLDFKKTPYFVRCVDGSSGCALAYFVLPGKLPKIAEINLNQAPDKVKHSNLLQAHYLAAADPGDDDTRFTNFKNGRKLFDYCVVDYDGTADGDDFGCAIFNIWSNLNRPNSIMYGLDQVQVEIFQLNDDGKLGELVLKRLVVVDNTNCGLSRWHSSFIVDKYEIEFGKKYRLMFYNNNNLLATYDWDIFESKRKCHDVGSFKFGVNDEKYSENLFSNITGNLVSDRVQIKCSLMDAGFYEMAIHFLSNDLNVDSVLKNVGALCVDFVDDNGKVIYTKQTSPAKVDGRFNQVKHRQLKFMTNQFDVASVSQIYIYDAADLDKKNKLAFYKVKYDNAGKLDEGIFVNFLLKHLNTNGKSVYGNQFKIT